MWRTIYLGKLPWAENKFQVAVHWTIDLFFFKDVAQLVTARGIEQAHRDLEAGLLQISDQSGSGDAPH